MSSHAPLYEVHLGFWTNWSHGKIQGATITLTRQHGGFLIAFLAIFIGMVGKSFWRLTCFLLHRQFSSSKSQDGLYHQRQAILRNSDTAQDGAWRLLTSMLAWRSGSRARRPVLRLLPVILTAFAISAAFGVASIFSSNVTSEMLNQVLLKGSHCGQLDQEKVDTAKILVLLMPWQAERATKFLNYGTQCYTNASHTDGCNLYIKPRLPLTSTRGNPCPFGDNICKVANDSLLLDSGYLDSLEAFGINTPAADRFQLRMVHKCAPLKTQPYMMDHNDSDYGAVKRYMYGPVRNPRTTNPWSYELAVNNAFLPGDNTSSSSIPRLDYQLGTKKHYATPNETLFAAGVNPWFPIPALRLDDADVHLAFLSAPEIRYSGPVNDPWFSARTGVSSIHSVDGESEFEAYVQDEPLGVLACSHSVQYCNPNLPEGQRCEPLRGIVDPRASANIKKLFTTDSHFAVIKWVNNLLVSNLYTIGNTIAFAGAAALRARYALAYGYSGPLPEDQWQLEAENWVKAALTSLQDMFVTSASGLPESMKEFQMPPSANDTVARNMCANQKIVSTDYSSFNVLGVALILIFGVIFIALDLGLEPIVARWQRRRYDKAQQDDEAGLRNGNHHPLHAVIEWSQTGTLQLQRLAHEEAGFGLWSNCDRDVPVTEPGQVIAVLDLETTKHPRLQQQRSNTTSTSNSLKIIHSWAVSRTDTGTDTLVEKAELEKRKGRVDTETESPRGDFHAISSPDRQIGLGVQLEDSVVPAPYPQDWRMLR